MRSLTIADMGKQHSRGKVLRSWRRQNKVSMAALAREVGDNPVGGQLGKFERGERDLPVPLASALSVHTGISLRKLLNKDQYQLARCIVALVARDAAA